MRSPIRGNVNIARSSIDPKWTQPERIRERERLELAGRHGQGSIDSLMIREAEVESFISLLPARRPQLKRGR